MMPRRKQFDDHLDPPQGGCSFFEQSHLAPGQGMEPVKCRLANISHRECENSGDRGNKFGTPPDTVPHYWASRFSDPFSLTKQVATFASKFIATSGEHSNSATQVPPPLKAAIKMPPPNARAAVEEKNVFTSAFTKTSSDLNRARCAS